MATQTFHDRIARIKKAKQCDMRRKTRRTVHGRPARMLMASAAAVVNLPIVASAAVMIVSSGAEQDVLRVAASLLAVFYA